MSRIVANLMGGPRDGQQVSVEDDVTEVASGVTDGEQASDIPGKDGPLMTPTPVGRYVKNEATLRSAKDADLRDPHPNSTPERPVADLERFDHPIDLACDFTYEA